MPATRAYAFLIADQDGKQLDLFANKVRPERLRHQPSHQHREHAVTDKPDDQKTKAQEYENLADAAVDPEEKKKLKDLARTARNLAPDPGTG